MTMLPVLRRSLLSPTLRSGFSRSTIAPLLLQSRRTVASTVSNRPASQTFEHAATNVREEAGNTAADLAKRIAGANMTNHNVNQDDSKGFVGITSAIIKDVPRPAMVLGLAGGIPYLGASGTTVYLAHQAGLAASGTLTKLDPGVALTVLDQALEFQVTYGAVMLSFLGAMHWGMEFAGYGGEQGYKRLALGAAPVLFAWSTLSMQPMAALTAQWLGFTALWWADAKATSSGWAPRWYSQYRFYLSILVGTCIIGSLAGTSYYGPVAGHGFLSHDLELTRQQRKELIPEGNQMVKGPIEAVMPKTAVGEPLADFITIRKKQPKEENEKKTDSTEEKK